MPPKQRAKLGRSDDSRFPVPRFKPGDAVHYRSMRRDGSVRSLVNANDPEDIRLQGFRYIVEVGGWDWSVPEASLVVRAEKKPCKIRAKKGRFSSESSTSAANVNLRGMAPGRSR